MSSIVETTYLSGKVRKLVLPVYRGPADPDAPAQRRLLLPQGELAQIYDQAQPIHYLAFIELQAGSTRGNHYHKVKQEYIYVIGGEAVLFLEDTASKARESLPLQTGDLVFIPTGIAHAVRTSKAGQAVEFSPARFDLQDIYRYQVS